MCTSLDSTLGTASGEFLQYRTQIGIRLGDFESGDVATTITTTEETISGAISS